MKHASDFAYSHAYAHNQMRTGQPSRKHFDISFILKLNKKKFQRNLRGFFVLQMAFFKWFQRESGAWTYLNFVDFIYWCQNLPFYLWPFFMDGHKFSTKSFLWPLFKCSVEVIWNLSQSTYRCFVKALAFFFYSLFFPLSLLCRFFFLITFDVFCVTTEM